MFKKIFLFLVVVLFVLVMGKVSLAMMCGDHSEHSEHTQAVPSPSSGDEHSGKEVKELLTGNVMICPVTGDKFQVSPQTTSSEYQDKIYYFCCPGCKPMFEKDPAKYLKNDK